VKFLFLPAEHDPDSFIREHGGDAFARSVGSAMPLSRFVIESAREGCDLETAEGRALLASQAKPLVSLMPDGVLKTQLLSEISGLVQIGTHELIRLWGGSTASAANRVHGSGSHQPKVKGSPTGQWSPPEKYEVRQGRMRSNLTTMTGVRRQATQREDRAIQLLFVEMQAWDRISAMQHVLLCELPEPHGSAFRWLEQQLHEHGPMPWSALYQALQDEPMGAWVSKVVLAAPTEVVFDQTELDSILHELEKLAVSKELNEIAPQVGQDPGLFERFKQLNQRLVALKAKPN
jgi:DNA primase